MDVDVRRELSTEALGVLKEGIAMVFSRWWALQMAVENQWGGPDSRHKADQLASNIVSWFTQGEEQLFIDDLEVMLYKALKSLNTEAGDGSIEQVAEKLMIMHEECLEGNFKSVESLRKVPIPHVRQVVEEDDDDDDDDDDSGGGNGASDEANENAGSSYMMPDYSSNMMLDAPESSNSCPLDMPVKNPNRKVATEVEDGWIQVVRRRNRGKGN